MPGIRDRAKTSIKTTGMTRFLFTFTRIVPWAAFATLRGDGGSVTGNRNRQAYRTVTGTEPTDWRPKANQTCLFLSGLGGPRDRRLLPGHPGVGETIAF